MAILRQSRRSQRPSSPRPARSHRARQSRDRIFLCFEQPTKPMLKEAAEAGFYKSSDGTSYPRIQILTVQQLLNGKQPEYPLHRRDATFKKSPTQPPRSLNELHSPTATVRPVTSAAVHHKSRAPQVREAYLGLFPSSQDFSRHPKRCQAPPTAPKATQNIHSNHR